jgi:hypothetical protein
LHWNLRLAVAACFIGHGAFVIITKLAWLPYFAVFGIPESWAWRLTPVVGAVDVAVGTLTLFQPVRAVILYMTFWGLQTACLRPLAGQGLRELLERAGNYGGPSPSSSCSGRAADWFSRRPAPLLTEERARATGWILRVTTALLLIGHGGFDVVMTQGLERLRRRHRSRPDDLLLFAEMRFPHQMVHDRLSELRLPRSAPLSVIGVELLPQEASGLRYPDPLGGDLGQVRILHASPCWCGCQKSAEPNLLAGCDSAAATVARGTTSSSRPSVLPRGSGPRTMTALRGS